jgi:hypothetical protein
VYLVLEKQLLDVNEVALGVDTQVLLTEFQVHSENVLEFNAVM